MSMPSIELQNQLEASKRASEGVHYALLRIILHRRGVHNGAGIEPAFDCVMCGVLESRFAKAHAQWVDSIARSYGPAIGYVRRRLDSLKEVLIGEEEIENLNQQLREFLAKFPNEYNP